MAKKQDRDETLINRNLKFPRYVWEALDRDAIQCKRSAAMQLLALLEAYYDLDHSEMSEAGMERMRYVSGTSRPKSETEDEELQSIKEDKLTSTTFIPSTKKKGGRR